MIRFVIFFQGCTLKCKYCHNRDTWKINTGKTYSSEELVNKILKYKSYIDSSGGGVTVSGGEPLLQAEFIKKKKKKLKDLNIHTAIDTAGSIPINTSIKELLKYTDLVLLDIKHINNEKCINLTGFPNINNLDFAKYLSNINKKVWIRQVIVPGYTDDKYDLYELKKFIESLNNVEKVELLPYHNMGKYKWEKLGEKYSLENVPSPTPEEIEKIKNILNIQ